MVVILIPGFAIEAGTSPRSKHISSIHKENRCDWCVQSTRSGHRLGTWFLWGWLELYFLFLNFAPRLTFDQIAIMNRAFSRYMVVWDYSFVEWLFVVLRMINFMISALRARFSMHDWHAALLQSYKTELLKCCSDFKSGYANVLTGWIFSARLNC